MCTILYSQREKLVFNAWKETDMATTKRRVRRGVGGDGREYNAGYKRNPQSVVILPKDKRKNAKKK